MNKQCQNTLLFTEHEHCKSSNRLQNAFASRWFGYCFSFRAIKWFSGHVSLMMCVRHLNKQNDSIGKNVFRHTNVFLCVPFVVAANVFFAIL